MRCADARTSRTCQALEYVVGNSLLQRCVLGHPKRPGNKTHVQNVPRVDPCNETCLGPKRGALVWHCMFVNLQKKSFQRQAAVNLTGTWSMKFAVRMSERTVQPVLILSGWHLPPICRSCVFGEQFLWPGYALRIACQCDLNWFYGCAVWKGNDCIERNFR